MVSAAQYLYYFMVSLPKVSLLHCVTTALYLLHGVSIIVPLLLVSLRGGVSTPASLLHGVSTAVCLMLVSLLQCVSATLCHYCTMSTV